MFADRLKKELKRRMALNLRRFKRRIQAVSNVQLNGTKVLNFRLKSANFSIFVQTGTQEH